MPGRRSLALVAAALTLVACGPRGGGDDPAPTAVVPPTATAVPDALVTVPAAGGGADAGGDAGGGAVGGGSGTGGGGSGGGGAGSAPARGMPFVADTSPDTGGGSGGDLVDVRSARHVGFDRVVLQFDEDRPPFRAEYVGAPRALGDSDVTRDIGGRAWLHLALGQRARSQPGVLVPDTGTTEVVEVRWSDDREGSFDVLVGLRHGDLPFRVFTLDAPPRVVLDVVHADRTG